MSDVKRQISTELRQSSDYWRGWSDAIAEIAARLDELEGTNRISTELKAIFGAENDDETKN